MWAGILDRLEVISSEVEALRGELDPALWLDLREVVQAISERIREEGQTRLERRGCG